MLNYDETNPISIKNYAEKLINKTFSDVLKESTLSKEEQYDILTKMNDGKHKGGVGHLIEKYYFEYEINNEQEPDFPKAGVELKVTPYEIGKKGGYRAGERLVITMISYKDPVEPDFFLSHLYSKTKLTLLIQYLRNRTFKKADYPIHYVTLFSPPPDDLKIIQQDYEYIINKIKNGKAHELSEGDTMYLGACTKGATAAKSLMPQEYYAPDILAPRRAFCLKQSYMTYILNQYVRNKVNTYESILSTTTMLENQTFENIIVDKINSHIGKSATSLSQEFNLVTTAKNFHSLLAYRMLGIRSNKAEEFIKADIEVKALRFEKKGTLKESISFPTMNFLDFAEEEWEDSQLYNTLSAKRYLFVMYQQNGEDYILKGSLLWNMPYEDLEEVKNGWQQIQDVVKSGPTLQKKYNKNGVTITNNFPKKSDHRIIHIRPHASKSYYVLKSGEIIGDNPNNGDVLPNGEIMTKQSFWLNNDYVVEQVSNKINISL